MERVCFRLQVKPDRLAEYAERHAAVWPDMCRALDETGWHNYSLFLDSDGLLIGYLETPSLAEAQSGMAATEVNARWQSEMAEFFVGLDGSRQARPADEGSRQAPASLETRPAGGSPDTGFTRLVEVFHLEDQLPFRTDPHDDPAGQKAQ